MIAHRMRLLNDPNNAVSEMLAGYVAAHKRVIRLDEHGNVIRAVPKGAGKVGLVAGNGSGHEPALIGWVGEGLLDVNVPGPVFSSPGPLRIVQGIEAADRGAGVLLCVSSHAGDLINAKLAMERARSKDLKVQMVALYDDIASAPKGQESDRRGSVGLFFVWKIVGALAEAGASLSRCRHMAERVRDSTRTLTAAIGNTTHPLTNQVISPDSPNAVTIGVGVHGEPGTGLDGHATAESVGRQMLSSLIEDAELVEKDRVGVLINNAGGMTLMELSILYGAVEEQLSDKGIAVHDAWIGSYATTVDLAGFGIALCRLDDEMMHLYDAPALGGGFERSSRVVNGVHK